MPYATELRVYDNSVDADPATGMAPKLKLLLQTKRRRIMNLNDLKTLPNWAKPIVAAAMKIHAARR